MQKKKRLMLHSIAEISYNTVKPLSSKASKDKVCLKDTPQTQWFGAYIENELCGVAGAAVKDGNGRIRGVYVLPQHRGKGLGSTMMQALMAYFDNKSVCYVEQLASQPDWWLKQGWKLKAPHKNGAWIYKTL